jgi:DNA-directed RNA polymerase sigma subunit (sigma70/sigma32)
MQQKTEQQIKNLKVKNKLHKYAYINFYLQLFKSKIDTYRELKISYDGLKANKLKELNIVCSRVSDPVLQTILKTTADIAGTVDFFDDRIQKLIELELEVTEALDLLDPIDMKIIDMRYLREKKITWSDVARKLNYDEECVKKRHGKVLCKLSELL